MPEDKAGAWRKADQDKRLLSPLTPDNVEGYKDDNGEEEAPQEETAQETPAAAAVEAAASVQGAVTTIKSGKVVISIKEGKDIYLELPI